MKSLLHKIITVALLSIFATTVSAQTASVSGKVISNGKPLELATVKLSNTLGTITDSS